MSLANKYRPKEFEDVCSQKVNCTILTKEIENNSYGHALLFSGPAGCGKTTCARIFSSKIDGQVFEIDCASHNGVSDIKDIIDTAKKQSILHKNKVFILDECHTLSPQAWSSLLIPLEENIENTVFIFCTTDTQKIPFTIMSRLQRFNFVPITENDIVNRLKIVCNTEKIKYKDNALLAIAKISKGNLRQALTNLDKCIVYGDLTESNVRDVLNIVSIDMLGGVANAVLNHDVAEIIALLESIYNNGYELHLFMTDFLDYVVNNKIVDLMDVTLTIMQDIRYETSPKNIIIARFLTYDPATKTS